MPPITNPVSPIIKATRSADYLTNAKVAPEARHSAGRPWKESAGQFVPADDFGVAVDVINNQTLRHQIFEIGLKTQIADTHTKCFRGQDRSRHDATRLNVGSAISQSTVD
jgi:hypothetical protein